ncbi:hypothetical protein Tco_0875523 [Tanacetum coccineum]|uniref:Uncharacterized protein n=1 Tax=Tanacetum coccineum TaxID=301880 RepID=A0ABQ5BSJ7_9ASTR
METQKALLKDADGEDVDEHLYRSMIGSLMYLTSSRPDIMFAVYACARFQVNLKVLHLHDVKRIFRYLKGQPKLGLWYLKDSPFNLVAYTDSDYAGASLDRKSTIGGCQFLGCRLISWQCKKQTVVANSTTEAEYIAPSNCCGQATAKVKTINGEVQIQALVDKKKVIITETSVRSDLQLEDAEGTECLPNATIFEQLTLMGYENLTQKLTFYKAFFSPQWKFLIHTILQCLNTKTTVWNEFSSTMDSAVICLATNQKFNFSKYIFDNMVKNLEGGVKFLMYPRFVQVFLDKQVEGMSKHKEIYVTPSHTKKVFANMKRQGKDFSGRDTPLFPTMIVQAQEQVELVTGDTENVASVSTHSNDPLLSGKDRLKLNELMELCTSLSQIVLDLETTKTAQAKEIACLKKRVKKMERKKKSKTPGMKRLFTIGRSAQVVSSEDKGLGDQEDASKQGRKINEIDQDAEVTLVDETQGRYGDNLIFDTGVLGNEQDMAEKEVDMAEKGVSTTDPITTAGEVVSTANVVFSTTEVTTDNTTTTTVDELTLAQTLIEIKAAKPKARGVIVQEPSEFTTTTSPSQPSQLPQAKDKGKEKMVEPKKPLKKKDQIIQREEDANIAKWEIVQAMMDADYELAARLQAEDSKRAGEELESKNLKKQKLDKNIEAEVDDDQEEAKMKKHMEIVLDEEVVINAIPLATKPLIIVDWKIIKEGQMGYFQIIRADGSLKRYSSMIQMLQSIDREDLETLWKLVKAKHGLTRPKEGYERVLWGDLKVMFEPNVEKKRYPLTPATIIEMLNKKLQADHWNEVCYQLLKIMTKQLKNPKNV